MIEYKEGDNVRCKKFYKDKHKVSNLYNGSMYTIESIWTVAGSGEPKFKPSYGLVRVGGQSFTTIVDSAFPMHHEYFYEYFHSKKELRELKLNKINKQNMKQSDIYNEVESQVKNEGIIEKLYGISEISKGEPLFTTSQETDVWEMIRDGMGVNEVVSIIRQW